MPSPVATGPASARWPRKPRHCAPGPELAAKSKTARPMACRFAVNAALAGLLVAFCRAFQLLAATLNVLAQARHRVATRQQSGKQNAPDPTFLHAGLLSIGFRIERFFEFGIAADFTAAALGFDSWYVAICKSCNHPGSAR
ncbi:hypothetical protein CT19431_MP130073 [Cupriavidus taiwanensis]|nr:hypothetical protein CT19431_MP130073 [Cupriavidus taiwanensis]